MHTITLIPGDGIGPEVTAGGRPDSQGRRHSTSSGNATTPGVIAFKRFGAVAARRAARLDPQKQGRAQGSGHDADRRGVHERERRLAEGARPLREPPARAEPAGRAEPLHRTSTWSSCARTPRISTPGLEHEVVPGRGREPEDHHREGVDAHRASSRSSTPARHGRKKVTAIHKANIMKLERRPVPRLRADGRRATIPTSRYDERIVDAACMQLVMHPEKFDVLLLPNLYGDIVSDLCAGLVGGLGVVPGANIGDDIGGLRGGARQRAGHRRTRTSPTRPRCCSRR